MGEERGGIVVIVVVVVIVDRSSIGRFFNASNAECPTARSFPLTNARVGRALGTSHRQQDTNVFHFHFAHFSFRGR
jgi:hypothetical protein